jgi:hypothetical protein
MKLTLIGLLIIIIIMLFVQISFRDNFDVIKQKAFREDQINYNLKKLRSIDSDGKEVQCGEIDGDKIIRKNICEGFEPMDKNKHGLLAKECSLVNGITDWRVRASKIPENTETSVDGKKKGCGFCFDTKNVYYGDENGPFNNTGPTVCNNWIKPGSRDSGGGSSHEKNIFSVYPFKDDLYKNPSDKRYQFGQGVKEDTVKMYEQEICRQMKNCGDQNETGADGTALCGWCQMGRKGDGEGEGMVRKGGEADQNETKYDDDFCHWAREINEKGQKTHLYKKETEELREWKESDDNRGRLINGLVQCAASNSLFPCLSNFSGKIVNENGEIKHSKECYEDIWDNHAKYNDITCKGGGIQRIKEILPSSRTFTLWDKTYIPSVETTIQKIPERMVVSKQYNENYDVKGIPTTEKDDKWSIQRMFSALLNSKVCTKNEPELDPCDYKYRSRDYNFFRPKSCIDEILNNIKNEKNKILDTVKNRPAAEFITDTRYIPGDISTYRYYWSIKDPDWEEGIHFDWTNEEFKNKLREKWDDLNKLQACKTQGNINGQYDKALIASKYLLSIVDQDIIELLGGKLWQDNDGGTGKPWVKMCWEDFRLELKTVWGNKDTSFLNKKGDINITGHPEINNLITNDTIALSYKDNGVDIHVKITKYSGNVKYITKQNYEHKYFPFWRLWKNNTKYYITSQYTNHTKAKQDILASDKASRSQENEKWDSNYDLSLK